MIQLLHIFRVGKFSLEFEEDTKNLLKIALVAVMVIAISFSGCKEQTDAQEIESPAQEEAATGITYPLVDTGQTACYDDDGNEIEFPEPGEVFYGQDAQFEGNLYSYTDNGDGTVTDEVTELMWQQTPSSGSLNWEEANEYCESLELAGYDDWRMPTLKELYSISDFSQGWPYLDTAYFDLAGKNVSKDEQYWAADYYAGTTVEGGSEAAFGVNHGTGHIKAYPATVSGPMGNYVRAVRGNSYGINDLEANGDGTVTDNATGLMWQQADSGIGMDRTGKRLWHTLRILRWQATMTGACPM
jgi:hypothetical protein